MESSKSMIQEIKRKEKIMFFREESDLRGIGSDKMLVEIFEV
jgi:hypothetical protein